MSSVPHPSRRLIAGWVGNLCRVPQAELKGTSFSPYVYRNIKLAVILSERGPERFSVRGW